ncbi:MAG: lytic transglycosylase domain-containing protein [Pseudomonadota bacterium]
MTHSKATETGSGRVKTVWRWLAGAVLLLASPAAALPDDGSRAAPAPAPFSASLPLPRQRPAVVVGTPAHLCHLIADNAARVGMQPDFFARLIWKESRFDIKAVSPVGAEGVAQFMPYTARERGLKDPYDPEQAIPASADFLADLKRAFGNWGLAAAAYNGGPSRVETFIKTRRGLPYETIDYVQSITYRPAEWFLGAGREVEVRPLDPEKGFHQACSALPVMRTRALAKSGRRSYPWGVQVAQGVTRSAALRAFKRVRSRYSAVLGGKSAGVYRSKRRTGARYAARIGANSRKAAGQLCARLKRIGGACVVLRN